MSSVTGLLYSQIGYDVNLPKRAILRGPKTILDAESARCVLFRSGDPAPAFEGRVYFWGELWGGGRLAYR